MAKLVQIIETHDRRGNGTPENPHRLVKQLFATDGTLVMEDDPQASMELEEWRSFRDNLLVYGYQHSKSMRGNLDALQQLVERWELEEGDHG